MAGVVLMAREKKNPPKPELPAAREEDKEQKNVKINPPLHRKLKTLAAWKGIELKDLIEKQLEQFAAQEWKLFLDETGGKE